MPCKKCSLTRKCIWHGGKHKSADAYQAEHRIRKQLMKSSRDIS